MLKLANRINRTYKFFNRESKESLQDLIKNYKNNPLDLDNLVIFSEQAYQLDSSNSDLPLYQTFDELSLKSKELNNQQLLKLIYAGNLFNVNFEQFWYRLDIQASQRKWESVEDLSAVYSFMPLGSQIFSYLKEQYQSFLTQDNKQIDPDHLNIYFKAYFDEDISIDHHELCKHIKEKYKLLNLSSFFLLYSQKQKQSISFWEALSTQIHPCIQEVKQYLNQNTFTDFEEHQLRFKPLYHLYNPVQERVRNISNLLFSIAWSNQLKEHHLTENLAEILEIIPKLPMSQMANLH